MRLPDLQNMPWIEILVVFAIAGLFITIVATAVKCTNSEGHILTEDGTMIPFDSYIFTSDSCVRIDTGETICGTFRIIEKE